ncbi:MAG: NAD(+) synthase [Deltaproteobacteria bacterium]|nr:NAD(+) synthase [Deltaproteobacteria bacterium]
MNLKIAMNSFDPWPGEIEKNRDAIISEILVQKKKNTDLLIFPEMALGGYCLGDLHKDESFIERQKKALGEIVAASSGITIVLGLTVQGMDSQRMSDGSPARYNGYAVISDGEVIAMGKKTLLVDEGVLEDSRYFLLGDEKEINTVEITVRGEKIKAGVLVCQDMWDDFSRVHVAETLKKKGASFLIVINSSPFYVGKLSRRIDTALRRVSETGLQLVYVNASGIQDIGKNIVIFDGRSFAVTPQSVIIQRGFTDESLEFEMSTSAFVEKLPSYTVKEDIAVLSDALIYTLREFFRRSKVFSGAVIGLSGGIDSALDALLLSRALGSDKLLCVNMPGKYNSTTTRSIASRIAMALECTYMIHPIQEIVDLKKRLLIESLGSVKDITMENLQARIRGSILMEYSQETNYMVIGNGNKTEFQRGYATLYGDILGAVMPLGDVPKLKVFELARHLDPDYEILPEEIFSIKPSAELSVNHNVDENQGDPFDYYVESPLGVELIERNADEIELVEKFRKKTLSSDIWVSDPQGKTVYDKFTPDEFSGYIRGLISAIRGSYFKRVQAPPIPVVSPRAFGLDFRESLFIPPGVK